MNNKTTKLAQPFQRIVQVQMTPLISLSVNHTRKETVGAAIFKVKLKDLLRCTIVRKRQKRLLICLTLLYIFILAVF